MRNTEKRKSNKMKVDNSNRMVQSYEKLENPQFLHPLTCRSPTGKDMCFYGEKEPVKETKKLLRENEEMSVHTKENNPNDDLHRISADKCYQPKSLSNVSDRKDKSLIANKKKNSNQSKNGVNSPVWSTRDHSSKGIQKGQSNINEASVNCNSPPNEKSNVNTIENLKSKETMPEESNTKIKHPRNTNSRKYQLKIEMPLNTSQALNGPQNEIRGLTSSEEHQFSNQNTTDNMEKRKDDNFLKLKQNNLQDRTLRKEDTIKRIQQTKLNVYAKEFLPTNKCYNQTRSSKKNEKKETVTPNSTNVKNLKVTSDRQHTAESQNFIKKNEKVEKNERISTSCENKNSPNEPVNNETSKHDGFENESINFSNSYESQYNGEYAYVFPEHLTDQNGFNCGFNTNSNYVQCKSLVLQCNYKGTAYFHVYPDCVYGGHSWFTLFNRRTNESLSCPYCQSLNSVNEFENK